MFGVKAIVNGATFHVASLSMVSRINGSLTANLVVDGIPDSINVGSVIKVEFSDGSLTHVVCKRYYGIEGDRLAIEATDYLGMQPRVKYLAMAQPNAKTSCKDFLAQSFQINWGTIKPLVMPNWLAIDVEPQDLIQWVANRHQCLWYSDHQRIYLLPLTATEARKNNSNEAEVIGQRKHSDGEQWEVGSPLLTPGEWVDSANGSKCVLQSHTTVSEQSWSCWLTVGTPAAPSMPEQRGHRWSFASVKLREPMMVQLDEFPDSDAKAFWLEPKLEDFSVDIPPNVKDRVAVSYGLGVSCDEVLAFPFAPGQIQELVTIRAKRAKAHYESLETKVERNHDIESSETTLTTSSLAIEER